MLKFCFLYFHTMWCLNPRNDIESGQAPSFQFQCGGKVLKPDRFWKHLPRQFLRSQKKLYCHQIHHRATLWLPSVVVKLYFTYELLKHLKKQKVIQNGVCQISCRHTFYILKRHKRLHLLRAMRALIGGFSFWHMTHVLHLEQVVAEWFRQQT